MRGVIQALIAQNPFQMGYRGVKSVLALIRGETVPKRIDSGVAVVTLENMDTPEIRRLLSQVEQK